ncbi:MAG: restriction endonuclease subunit S [Alistipes sp.]|nr:restriction endonuclease subunit S [Alistipes sp.]
MKRYEKYKPTGIQWLPEIPEHWNIKYLFQVSHEHYISNKDIHHQNLLSLSYGKIVHKDINTTEGLLPASFDTYQIIEPGNIVFRFTDLQNDHKSLRVGLSKETGIITSAYIAVAVDKDYVLPEYFYYTLHSFDIKKLFYSMGSGLRQSLNYNGIRKLRLPIPPINEQIKTIAYLDKRITLIEDCKCQRERELQTLNELKQAEIASVVTRGLNPDVPMKDSGQIQFGKVPAHWDTIKLKYCFNQRSEKGFPNEPVLCATQSKGVIPQSLYENRVVVVNKGFDGLKLVKVGDFVISLRSFQGGIEYAYYQGIISSAYTILTPKDERNSKYFKYLFKSHPFIQLLQTCVTGIREGQNINYSVLGNNFIPVPPIEEQNAIVEYIESKTSKIDTMIEALKAEIDRLTEYKQRLISDVVTGQIDVRGEQI